MTRARGLVIRLAWLTLGGGVVALGCGGGRGPTHWSTENTWSSAHFVFHARPDDASVDARVIGQLEANAALVRAGWLNQPPETWGPIHYFKYPSLDDLTAAGSPCVDRPCALLFESGRIEIHTPLAIDQHELVHGYTMPIACAPSLFKEGLAVSIGCDPAAEPLATVPLDRPGWLQESWRDLTSFDGPLPLSYEPAGVLVTWIVDNWGAGRFFEFYRDLGCNPSQDQIARVFFAHYGMSLDDVWSQLVTAPRRRMCLFLEGCAETEATGQVELTNQSAGYRLAVAVPAGGALLGATYAAASDPPVVRACAPEQALPGFDGHWPIRPAAWSPTILVPTAGRTVVALRDVHGLSTDASRALALTVTPLPAPAADPATCAGVQPLSIDDLQLTALIWPHLDPVVFGLRSTMAASSLRTRILADGATDAVVEACSDCVAGVLRGCAPAALTDTLNAPWIRIQWAPSSFALMTLQVQWL